MIRKGLKRDCFLIPRETRKSTVAGCTVRRFHGRRLSPDLLFSADSEPEEDDDIVSTSHNDQNASEIESRRHRDQESKYIVEPFLLPFASELIFFRVDPLGARQQPLGASSTVHHSELMVSVDRIGCR